jgi:hypothetical protein
MEWLRVKALSLNPSTAKKKKKEQSKHSMFHWTAVLLETKMQMNSGQRRNTNTSCFILFYLHCLKV